MRSNLVCTRLKGFLIMVNIYHIYETARFEVWRPPAAGVWFLQSSEQNKTKRDTDTSAAKIHGYRNTMLQLSNFRTLNQNVVYSLNFLNTKFLNAKIAKFLKFINTMHSIRLETILIESFALAKNHLSFSF